MATLADLFVKLSADTREFKQPLEDAGKQIEELGGKVDATGPKFESFAEGLGQWIERPLGSAGEAAKSFVLALGPIGTVALASAAGLAALGKEITELVLAEGSAAEKTQNLADRLNLSFEQTKKFSEMASVAGVNVGVLEKVSMRLADALQDSGGSGKDVAAVLDKMGIAANDSGEAMVKVLEKLASIPDATERISLAHQIMGKGAVELEPLLKNYASLQAAVEELGGVLDSEVVAKLTKADDAADLLAIAWSHLKEGLAGTFAPAVTVGIELLTKLLSGTPSDSLEKQLMKINEQLIQMPTLAAAALTETQKLRLEGEGGGFGVVNATTTDQDRAALEARKREIEGLIEATRRSKEYNEEIAKSNRANELWAQGIEKRAKEASAAWKKAFSDLGITDFEKQAEQLKKDFDLIKDSLDDDQIASAQQKIADALNHVDEASRKAAAAVEKAREEYEAFSAAAIRTAATTGIKLAEGIFPTTFFADAKEALKVLEALDKAIIKIQSEEQGGKAIQGILALPEVQNVIALEEAIKHFGLVREQSVQETLAQNKLIQESDILTLREKVEAESRTIHELHLLREAETQGRLKNAIALKELTGESATAEIIALEQVRLKQEQLAEQSQRMGRLYVDLMHDFKGAFDTLGKGVADNLIEWKNWGDVLTGLLKQIAKTILEDLVGAAFGALGAAIIKQTGLAKGLASVFGVSGAAGGAGAGLGGLLGLGKKAGAPPVNLPGGMPPGGDLGDVVNPGSSASPTAGSGGLGSLAGITSIASLGVEVASGITNGIQNARMTSLLSGIEISTRATKEQLVGGTQTVLLTWLPKLDHLTDIWAEIRNLRAAVIQNTAFLSDILNNQAFPGVGPALSVGEKIEGSTNEAAEVFKQVANSGRNLSRGFANLNTAAAAMALSLAPQAPAGFTGSGFPGMGGTTEFALASGFELNTGGPGASQSFSSWIAAQNFQNAGPLIEYLKGTGVTDTQLFQSLAKFGKGFDFAGWKPGSSIITGQAVTNSVTGQIGSMQGNTYDPSMFPKVVSNLAGAFLGGDTHQQMTSTAVQAAVSQLSSQLQQMQSAREQQEQAAYSQQAIWGQTLEMFKGLRDAGYSLESINQSYQNMIKILQEKLIEGQITGAQYEAEINRLLPLGVASMPGKTGIQVPGAIPGTFSTWGQSGAPPVIRAYAAAPIDYNASLQNYAQNLNTGWRMPSFGGGSGPASNGNVSVTVNALNQSGRAAADAFVLALQHQSIQVR